MLSVQQVRICRALLDGAERTTNLYDTDTPNASERASLSRSVRRLEELEICTRPKRGHVQLTEEGREFAEWIVSKEDNHEPPPWETH